MDRIKVFKSLARFIAYFLLFLSALILILWPRVSNYFTSYFEPKQVIGFVVAAVSVIIIDFYHLLSRLGIDSTVNMQHMTIKDAISKAESKKSNIAELRVFASTTEMILPAIRESNLYASNCMILVQKLIDEQDDKAKSMNDKCNGYIESWKGLIKQGNIGSLEIKRYDYLPNQYFIIFGDTCLIHGLYYPTTVEGHTVDFLEPIYVDSTTVSGQKLITKFTKTFDNLFDYALENKS